MRVNSKLLTLPHLMQHVLITEILRVAHALDNYRHPLLIGIIHHQPGKRDHLDIADPAQRLAGHQRPLLQREHVALGRVHPDSHNQPIERRRRTFDDIDVTIRNWVPRKGIHRR